MNEIPGSRRLPPLNSLRAFEAAGRHLSFTRAAEELAVTQAAVSHQVKALEDWLGLKLFRRQNRNVYLTETGQQYLTTVREALESLTEATQRLLRREASGAVTVSVLPSFAAKWLVPRVGAFRARHPDIDVRISANERLTDFAREDVDVGIRYGDGDWPGVTVVKFLSEDVFPVCSPALLAGARPLRTPADLKFHTLLHDDLRDDWRVWLLAAGVEGVDPSRGITFTDSSMVLQAAVDAQGVALGRSALAARDLDSGALVRPFEVRLPQRYAYYLAYPARVENRPNVQAFVDWVVETAADENTHDGSGGKASTGGEFELS